MVSIAQTTLNEIGRLKKDIVENNERLGGLTQYVMHMWVVVDGFLWRVGYDTKAVGFLAFILG